LPTSGGRGGDEEHVEKPEVKRPLGRLSHTWIDNNKIDLLEIGVNVVDWTGLVWLRIGTGGELL
jgi:hypothetical protein